MLFALPLPIRLHIRKEIAEIAERSFGELNHRNADRHTSGNEAHVVGSVRANTSCEHGVLNGQDAKGFTLSFRTFDGNSSKLYRLLEQLGEDIIPGDSLGYGSFVSCRDRDEQQRWDGRGGRDGGLGACQSSSARKTARARNDRASSSSATPVLNVAVAGVQCAISAAAFTAARVKKKDFKPLKPLLFKTSLSTAIFVGELAAKGKAQRRALLGTTSFADSGEGKVIRSGGGKRKAGRASGSSDTIPTRLEVSLQNNDLLGHLVGPIVRDTSRGKRGMRPAEVGEVFLMRSVEAYAQAANTAVHERNGNGGLRAVVVRTQVDVSTEYGDNAQMSVVATLGARLDVARSRSRGRTTRKNLLSITPALLSDPNKDLQQEGGLDSGTRSEHCKAFESAVEATTHHRIYLRDEGSVRLASFGRGMGDAFRGEGRQSQSSYVRPSEGQAMRVAQRAQLPLLAFSAITAESVKQVRKVLVASRKFRRGKKTKSKGAASLEKEEDSYLDELETHEKPLAIFLGFFSIEKLAIASKTGQTPKYEDASSSNWTCSKRSCGMTNEAYFPFCRKCGTPRPTKALREKGRKGGPPPRVWWMRPWKGTGDRPTVGDLLIPTYKRRRGVDMFGIKATPAKAIFSGKKTAELLTLGVEDRTSAVAGPASSSKRRRTKVQKKEKEKNGKRKRTKAGTKYVRLADSTRAPTRDIIMGTMMVGSLYTHFANLSCLDLQCPKKSHPLPILT